MKKTIEKATQKAITYCRVSKERKDKCSLSLSAQRQAVRKYAKANGLTLTSEFVEVESARKNKRPKLLLALSACKRERATLLIAKLDRLGRNVAFISALMESRVMFKAVDDPYADKLTLHIKATFAEHELDEISQRTIAALKVAKQRGVELGKYGRDVLSVLNKKQANEFAAKIQPIVRGLRQKGITTVRAIVKELNARHVPTYSKAGHWHIATVQNLLKRIKHTKCKKSDVQNNDGKQESRRRGAEN